MKFNDAIFKTLGLVITGALVVFFVSTISGTIVWLLYPHIHILFPTAAQNGIIATTLTWWDSVCAVWILQILFKASNPTRESK